MKVLAIQLDCAWEDRNANFLRAERLLAAKDPEPGSLVVLPEMFAAGFTMDQGKVAEASDGETASFLSRIAREYRVFMLGGAVTRGTQERAWNEALAFGPDGVRLARYRKLHPFTFAGEAEHYQAGDEIALFSWNGLRVAPFICYDLRFPEVFRLAVLAGAEVMAVIANWPARRAAHWKLLLRARALENQAYVVGVNRAGRDPHHAYAGGSLIVGPDGEVEGEMGAEEGMLAGILSPERLREARARLPVLPDIRAELLGRLRLAEQAGDGTNPAAKRRSRD
jgi:omega-amidase